MDFLFAIRRTFDLLDLAASTLEALVDMPTPKQLLRKPGEVMDQDAAEGSRHG
jgi:hypothetical protein